jgi:hypothetical protein
MLHTRTPPQRHGTQLATAWRASDPMQAIYSNQGPHFVATILARCSRFGFPIQSLDAIGT